MSTIRTMEARMPPGFRFHPRDDELVLDYLLPKLSGHCHARGGVAMADVDVNKCEPWDLPEECCVSEGNEWYFFSLPDRKYTTGERTNRATRSGYWKATGKDRAVVAVDDKTVKTPATLVGRRKTLVFYTGRAPNGRKTAWVMHEFRVELPSPPRLGREVHFPASARHQRDHFVKGNWVLCRVLYKSGTTTPRPASEDQAGMPTSYEPDLPVTAPPVIAAFNAIDGSRTAAGQVSCFSGLPALPFRRPVSRGDGHAMDISEKQATGIMVSSMASMISTGLELAPNWEQENDMAQLWNRLYC